MAVLGDNGAGKTTLLRTLLGLTPRPRRPRGGQGHLRGFPTLGSTGNPRLNELSLKAT
ncbi:ATP-binding cassette domain-containing protein [Streptomyces erythrochromogenes]